MFFHFSHALARIMPSVCQERKLPLEQAFAL